MGDRPGWGGRSPRATHEAGSSPSFRRCWWSVRRRCSRTCGWEPTACCAGGLPIGEKRRRATQVLTRTAGRDAAAGCPRRDVVVERAAGVLRRPGARARPPRPDSGRVDVSAGRRHARPAVRHRAAAVRQRGRRDLHLAPDGRDRGAGRSGDGASLRRERRHARAWAGEHRGAGAAHDRRGPSHRGRGSGLAPPARRWRCRAARARRCGWRRVPRRSTSRCAPGSSWDWPDWRVTVRTRFCARCTATRCAGGWCAATR